MNSYYVACGRIARAVIAAPWRRGQGVGDMERDALLCLRVGHGMDIYEAEALGLSKGSRTRCQQRSNCEGSAPPQES